METIDLQALRVFVAVAESGSFSGAARQLGITKGTVSRAVAALEASTGSELVHRTTRHVALSTAGVALYERAAPHLLALAEAATRLPEREARPSGILRVTAPTDIGQILLPEVMARYTRRYPDVRVELVLTSARLDLMKEGLDVAIRGVPRLDDAGRMRKLIGGSLGVYASPGYLARRGAPRKVGADGHDWVIQTAVQRTAKVRTPRVVVNDFLVARDLLRAGCGVGVLPTMVGEPCIAAGELTRVMPGLRLASSVLVLLFASDHPPRRATAFRDLLVEALR
jgi:DNA-binding transcriptional LysR family regulator